MEDHEKEREHLCSQPLAYLPEFNFFKKVNLHLKSPHRTLNVAFRAQPKAESKSHYFQDDV